eukprot:271830_1
MPSGKSCYVYYAFDGGSFVTAKTHTSSGITLQTFRNQSFTVPDHSDLKYKNITIKFMNNALYDNEYCYVGDVYVFVGDLWLEYDDCEEFDSSWTYSGAAISTSNCHSGSCVRLYSASDWAIKTFDISNYNNLVLRVDLILILVGHYFSWKYCYVHYFYDNEPASSLGSVFGYSQTEFSNRKFSIPDSKICGASTLSIRFQSDQSDNTDCTVDNIVLLGNILDTASPTAAPILLPTTSPTTPTSTPTQIPSLQTLYPSSNPTTNPTLNPTRDPTIDPTIDPTANPTIDPTINPTRDPTIDPTINPTMHTTSYPTVYPTMNPTVDRTADPTLYPIHTSISPFQIPTVDPIQYSTMNLTYIFSKYPTTHPTKDPLRNRHTVDSTLVTSSRRVDTSESPASKTVEALFVTMFILLVLLFLLVNIRMVYMKRQADIKDDKEQNEIRKRIDATINDMNNNIDMEGNEFEGTAFKDDFVGKRTDDSDEITQKLKERQRQIYNWFTDHVQLEECNQKYYSLFMKNGYDRLSLIAELTNEDLIEMEIKMAHRKRIMKAVQVLLNTDILYR